MTDRRPIFVIQEHDATTHHYDVRLEIDGVLKSWAVPKGPSTDPREKRLAVPTPDHRLEYAAFEGVIPEGEEGAGPVLIWDRGRFDYPVDPEGCAPPEDAATLRQAYEAGHLVVRLDGEKLSGGYAFQRMGKKASDDWLMIKTRDEAADARRNPTSSEPHSVKSGRTLEQVRREGRSDG